MDEVLQVRRLEQQVGNPADRWAGLKVRIRQENLQRISEIRRDFLDILWCLDLYRVAGVPPRGMGNPNQTSKKRLEGAYRMKGGWFAELVSLILENQTESALAPRTSVQGFSQLHQIDIAWPARRPRPIRDPLVCVETKVMGGPAYDGGKERPARADWSNRRKELKFQATDLKLYRRQ
ncbi:hypothetical protein [Jiangella alkaliphila]|uniref:Uncharacterized protein n=1 Tax=Jiangella alkaliphila TaxID=419479 RepID=A0A1H2KP92_9ACTN|nr:hypothetical protein [Jiangella alkaliphila]SDU70414.1 hypothetical protein SAMN04488563_4075 [Jiangella alkaliphila]